MKGSFCYMPVLKARKGSFDAIRAVSPIARSRLAPLFDILPPNAGQARDIGAYLQRKIDGIAGSWVPDRPLYLDAHSFPVESSIHGQPPVAVVAEALMVQGFIPIPVVGTESERGSEYLAAMSLLAKRLGTGLCLRVEREEIVEPGFLAPSLSKSIGMLGIAAEQVDLALDFDFVGKDSPASISSAALDAIRAAAPVGKYRNIIMVGGSIPERLPKGDTGVVRREARVELAAWQSLCEASGLSNPIAFGDFGVINAKYVRPGKAVNVPARVRYTTPREHVLLRTGRDGHADLCREIVAMEGEFLGPAYSAGDQQMSLAANGLSGPGNPAMWLAGDLNHHLELVSAQIWEAVRSAGLSPRFSLPEPRRVPWLQSLLLAR